MSKVPNALSRQQAARQVIARLQEVQEKCLYFHLLQAANDHDEDEAIPGSEPRSENGKFVYREDGTPVYPTYGESIGECEAAAERLRDKAQDLGLLSLVEKMLEAEHAAQENGAVV